MKITVLASVVPLDEKNGASVPVHRGEVADVPKAVADRLIRLGAATKGVVDLHVAATAVPVRTPVQQDVARTVPETTGEAPEVAPVDAAPGDAEPGGDDPDADDPDGDDVADLERPAQAAPLDTWVAYAVAQGVPESEASELTKKDLIARFT